ncbi:hypothetical protein [Adlercreutzia sp. ZJ141]|uniref:hypothetical protein n=1 Tax=Adlercreutzia sp. ZJ141 TaxID=2709406 RepID=UPI0013ED336F|nr:hypothetical protein [Adlercreutzia sp. ZJ141]
MIVASFRLHLFTTISDNADPVAYRKRIIERCKVLAPPHTPLAASASSKDWRTPVDGREANKKRRLAYTQGLLPYTYESECTKPDGRVLTAHEVEHAVLGRIKQGEPSAWDVLCAESLSEKCFSHGCAFDDGAIDEYPGWCKFVILGFEGWVM